MGNAQIVSTLTAWTIQSQVTQPRAIDLIQVDRYWVNFLGCSREQFYQARNTQLIPAPAHTGLWALARQGHWVVAAPPLWCDTIGDEIKRCFRPNMLPSEEELQQLLSRFPDQQYYGPGLVFLHEQPVLPHTPCVTIRPLVMQDAQAVAAFAAAAAPIPWTLTEPKIWIRVFGLFVEEQLVAACGVRVWGEMLAELYVDTAPAYRWLGYGKAVTHAALEWIYKETLYYAESVTELSNQASIKLLQRLGGRVYGYMAMTFSEEAMLQHRR